MTNYQMLCRILEKQAAGIFISPMEKQRAVSFFLSGVSSRQTVARYHQGVHQPPDGRQLYPLFYIPPYLDGKKLRLATGELPKTHLLASNYYELEILRILALWSPPGGRERAEISQMIEKTLLRLNTTCFAHYCPTGECVGAGTAAFRLLSAIPSCRAWAASLLKPLGSCFDGASGRAAFQNGIPVWYFVQALAGSGMGEAKGILERNQAFLARALELASKPGRQENPVKKAALANAIGIISRPAGQLSA